MKHYIGLDVSMKRTFICVINELGKVIREGSENTDPHLIADYLSKLGLEEMTVGFESGSLTPYLLTGFKEKAIEAVCMDARKLSPILALKVNKTDKNDARGIAEALRSGMYTRVHCKPEESINRAILLTARRALVEQQTHLKNTVLGMTPTQYSSGETQRQGKTSKCGSKELRSLLVEAGVVILSRSKKWSKLKAWGLKIMRKKGLKKAAVAVGRKLAVIMHRMMLEEKDFIYGEPKAA